MAEAKQEKRARRSFDDEFKQGAVRLVLDEGRTVTDVARSLDLTPSALRNWVEQARADRTKGETGLTTEERSELARLRLLTYPWARVLTPCVSEHFPN